MITSNITGRIITKINQHLQTSSHGKQVCVVDSIELNNGLVLIPQLVAPERFNFEILRNGRGQRSAPGLCKRKSQNLVSEPCTPPDVYGWELTPYSPNLKPRTVTAQEGFHERYWRGKLSLMHPNGHKLHGYGLESPGRWGEVIRLYKQITTS